MTTTNQDQDFSVHKHFWPIYLLGGFQSLAFGGFIILIVPLSSIIWPEGPYRPLEMGILITTLLWGASIGGLLFGFLIDKFSRTKIIFLISIIRAFSMIMIGFAIEGKGFQTWIYFLVFTIIFAFWAGGSWPAILSISNDIVPKGYRSRFFGTIGVVMGIFTTFGFLIASALVQYGFWRAFFFINGIGILISGVIAYFNINEPKRGAQEEILSNVLADGAKYDYEIDMTLMKKTMLSKTNRLALIEGIFTNLLMGSLHLLVLPYIQTEPHNLSPIFTAVYMIIFGLTGGLIGQILFAKMSDKVCKEHPIRRIYFIIIGLIAGLICFALVFLIPLPHLTVEQGKDIPFLFSQTTVWIMGMTYLASSITFALFAVNQAPVIQDINLPEAQGKIASWNQFIENFGYGLGPLIVGVMLTLTNANYQITVLVLVILVIPGIFLWFLAIIWYPHDREIINEILKERAEELKIKNPSNSKIPT